MCDTNKGKKKRKKGREREKEREREREKERERERVLDWNEHTQRRNKIAETMTCHLGMWSDE